MSQGQAGLADKAQPNGTLLRLLILEASASGAQALIDPLHNAGYAVTAARIKSPVEFQLALRKQEWDLALAPVQLPGFPLKQAIALLKHAKLDVPFIVMLDDCGDEDIVEALSNGASAIVKRHNLTQLRYVVERELRDLTHRRARHYYERMFRESERRCHTLLEASRDAIACVRADKIIYSNPAFNGLGAQTGAGAAPSLTSLVHPDERQVLADVIKRVYQQIANNERMELRVHDAEGREFKTTVEAALAHIELDHFDALVQRIGAAEAGRLSGDVAAHIVRLAGPQAKLSRHAGHILIALLPTGAADIAESICRHIAAQAR